MNVDLSYWGRSGTVETADGVSLSFAPNLARPKVFFNQELKHPLRFREAMSALHEVVVGDFKFKAKDKTAYKTWKAQVGERDEQTRRAFYDQAYANELRSIAGEPVSPTLNSDFRKMHALYWTARRQWASELARYDPELFRALVPCDPVVTVAPDVVFFECFAKDESSYGCLYVDRDAFFGAGEKGGLGTTNVDYSLALFDHFQTLRSFKRTRLAVDPSGFDVKVEGKAEHREEKIDLPSSWLRGFGQIQGAMNLARTRVELSVDVVYSILKYLRLHREKTGPRSLRFELRPGQPPRVVIEPWGIELVSRGAPYAGDRPQTIKVWGRRRLKVLARVLPLAEKFEVLLLGSGLPSVWTAHLGDMRFVLALSGWTKNDWTSGASLELLAADLKPDVRVTEMLTRYLSDVRSAPLSKLIDRTEASSGVVMGSLHQLTKQGQVIYDFARDLYRYRPVMPVALSEAVIGPEPEEVAKGKALAQDTRFKITRDEPLQNGKRLVQATLGSAVYEAIIDLDGGFTRAQCNCSFFYRHRLRAGPCQHLLALRIVASRQVFDTPPSLISTIKNWMQ